MQFRFEKWHGTGNDFVLFDDRMALFPADDTDLVQRICDRHFGIGSDGLILLGAPAHAGTDFHMEFFNPDGSKSFCGNGSRCAFAYWSKLNTGVEAARFSAIDGIHEGTWSHGQVSISIPPVNGPALDPTRPHIDFIDTGSPHLLVWVDDVEAVDILEDAPPRRRSARYGKGGTNVNYVQTCADGIRMRTFERGVEAETLSCGSGVVAAALSALGRGLSKAPVEVYTRGGILSVGSVQPHEDRFEGIRLVGPATFVFEGSMEI